MVVFNDILFGDINIIFPLQETTTGVPLYFLKANIFEYAIFKP
jgi:hypothetical protein